MPVSKDRTLDAIVSRVNLPDVGKKVGQIKEKMLSRIARLLERSPPGRQVIEQFQPRLPVTTRSRLPSVLQHNPN